MFLVILQGLCIAKETPIRVQPTIAHDGSAEVMRGGEVQITLDAIPNYGNEIVFEVSNPPAHGRLSNPKIITDHSASVIYRHDGTKAPLRDEFTFRAKTVGRAASAPSKIAVRIVPPAPLIIFSPDTIDFGEVILSESKTAKVKISNIGGTKASGRLVIPKEFTALESDRFALAEGESAQMEIGFSPMETRAYSGDVRILPSLKNNGFSVRGIGMPRMEVIKKGPAECAVINRSSNPIRVNFSGGIGWEMPREILLPPKAEKDVSFTQVKVDEGEGQTPKTTNSPIVHITDALTIVDMELPSPRRFIPLTVQSVSPEALGTVSLGIPIPVLYRLQNRSDVSKAVRWSMISRSGGGVAPQVQTLRPGEVKEFRFEWIPSIPGEALLTLNVDEGIKTHHELRWKAQVKGSPSPSAGVGAEGVGPAEASVSPVVTEAMNGNPGSSTATPVEAKSIPRIDQLANRLKNPWFGKPMLVLEWKGGSPPPSRITLDEMVLVREEWAETEKTSEGLPSLPSVKLEAVPIKEFNSVKTGDLETVSIPQLSPGWHLLILSLYQDDSPVPVASSQIQAHIPPKPSWWTRWRMPLGLLSVVLLLLFLRAQRAKSGS